MNRPDPNESAWFADLRYREDGRLLERRDGTTVSLRAKSLAVFRYLATHHNTVQAKAEIMQAVWPGLVVSDDSLTQCIAEIRRLMGPAGRQTLKTIPRQGYMLVADEPKRETKASRLTLIRPRILVSVALAFLLAGLFHWKTRFVVAPPAMQTNEVRQTARPSIAVLPFSNLSANSDLEYFSYGMSEDITTDLSKLSGLFVVSGNSAFHYKGSNVTTDRVAKELGVRYLLEGSVQIAGEKLRINVQLVDSTSGEHMWANRYDGSVRDTFDLQDQITDEITRTLAIRLLPAERKALANNNTNVPAAHDAFLRGWTFKQSKSATSLKSAKLAFEEAVSLDPAYGRAWGALAELYYEASIRDLLDELGFEKTGVSEVVNKAMIRPTVQAYRARIFELFTASQLEQIPSLLDKMESLEPNYAITYSWRGILAALEGRTDTALSLFQTARRHDPRNAVTIGLTGRLHLQIGDLNKARQAFEEATRVDPDERLFLPDIAATHALIGQKDLARKARIRLVNMREAHGFLFTTAGDFSSSGLFHPDYREQLRKGLVLAGLPLKLGLESLNLLPEYRVTGDELQKLLANNVRRKGRNPQGEWMIDHLDDGTGVQYWMGREVARRDWFIKDDKLHVSFRAPSNRDPHLCEIYRNPRGSQRNMNQYLSVCEHGIAPWAIFPLKEP